MCMLERNLGNSLFFFVWCAGSSGFITGPYIKHFRKAVFYGILFTGSFTGHISKWFMAENIGF